MRTKEIKLLLTMMYMLCSMSVSAYDFTVDGIYYEVMPTGITCAVVNGDVKYEGDIVIPSEVIYNNKTLTVTTIRSSSFNGCSGLTSVSIPSTVVSMESHVFCGCSNLISVNLPDAITYIGQYMFYGCSSLRSVNIPNSVTFIGELAFKDCI